jgi:hypothetical protein
VNDVRGSAGRIARERDPSAQPGDARRKVRAVRTSKDESRTTTKGPEKVNPRGSPKGKRRAKPDTSAEEVARGSYGPPVKGRSVRLDERTRSPRGSLDIIRSALARARREIDTREGVRVVQ